MGDVRPRVAVSSCLLGEPVRFNGGHSRDRFLTGALSEHVDWVPICPEMEIGLGTPRETIRLERSAGGLRLMTRSSRVDLTDRMTALAESRAAGLDVDGYVFKAKSPSCGLHGIPIHAAGAGTPDAGGARVDADRRNRGLFAGIVVGAHPLLAAEDEGRLRDTVLREAFVERIFAVARLRELLSGGWRARDLVAFHAAHKMQLLAHAPEIYRGLGRLVAEVGSRPRDVLAAEYGHAFRTALAARASVGRNANVLEHCLGMVGGHLGRIRRADVLEVIGAYRARLVALNVPVTLLRHHARGEGVAYVSDQTYFQPYPDDLGLRNHIAA
ncbi:DUF523 and DUF1722 domain-containing protein [Planotetraspora phitsanulokensis]|uniref:DUF1722 domain-containing protein n=1 Tax=Planotetraspora phitsanulokensis TaxID=575192 RepID=A0A8J3UHQ7_9ACTN|nr:DUF523 and DUF1722 domain-containing protein [Planotetraspora phitsanulokensis]GII42509.1 hypothetical protein Pph01_75120 [Planotetraspora phitsanulokensis]